MMLKPSHALAVNQSSIVSAMSPAVPTATLCPECAGHDLIEPPDGHARLLPELHQLGVSAFHPHLWLPSAGGNGPSRSCAERSPNVSLSIGKPNSGCTSDLEQLEPGPVPPAGCAP